MKSMRLVVLAVVCLAALVVAWSKEDHEIFRLRDELQAHEGHNETFYTFLDLRPSASLDDINKAYRKKSRLLHPDKASSTWLANFSAPKKPASKPGKKPGVHVQKHKQPSQREVAAFKKQAAERFSRLGLIANILRGPQRDRYDHFLQNGFPKWRGTGYYYERFRPGLVSVLFGLFIAFGGGGHYIALYLGWKRQRAFVDRYIRHARRMAWGDEGALGAIPGLGTNGTATPPVADSGVDESATQWNRKQKRLQDKVTRKAARNPKAAKVVKQSSGVATPVEAEPGSGPVGAKKRVVAENGKVLIVDSVGSVFLEVETEEGDRQEFLLDIDEIPKPTVYDTAIFRLPKWAYNRTIGQLLNKKTEDAALHEIIGDAEVEVSESERTLKSAVPANANGESRKRKARARN
ncbi:hypothetical protein LTR66_012000 [Elasticomyces elasticus]|nr:hypothetical protein LTR66_012000 [Elasticomyces elasticus]